MRTVALSVIVLAATSLALATLFAPATFAQDASTETAPTETTPAETASSVVVGFPDLEAARAAMTDEEIEPYISTLQTAEMSAKTGSEITGEGLAAQRAECRKRFAAGTIQFTDDEQAQLRWLAERVTDRYLGDYPLLAGLPWSFIKVKRSIEGGLPHTRGAHIVLTGSVASQIAAMRERAEEAAIRGMGSLLIHEQLHVAERAHRDVFEKLYTEEWGFERVESLPTCDWLDRNQVVNPDGVDIRWVRPFRRGEETIYVHPRVMFSDDGPKRMPWGFRMVGVFLKKTTDGYSLQLNDDGIAAHASLRKIPEYRDLFKGIGNTYHPNEALASLFPRMVIADAAGKARSADAGLRTWCRTNFATPK